MQTDRKIETQKKEKYKKQNIGIYKYKWIERDNLRKIERQKDEKNRKRQK